MARPTARPWWPNCSAYGADRGSDGYSDDGFVERKPTGGPEESSVTEAEDPPVRGHQPIAPSIGGASMRTIGLLVPVMPIPPVPLLALAGVGVPTAATGPVTSTLAPAGGGRAVPSPRIPLTVIGKRR